MFGLPPPPGPFLRSSRSGGGGVGAYWTDDPDPERRLPEHLYQPLPAREVDLYGVDTGLDLLGDWTVLVQLDNRRIRSGYLRAFGWDPSGSAAPAREEVHLRIVRETMALDAYNELPGETVGTRQQPSAALIPILPNQIIELQARDLAPGVNRGGIGRLYGWWD